MCFFYSLIPATVVLVIGYFVLYAATKAEHCPRVFGKIVAIWLFIISALIPLGSAYLALTDSCPKPGECPMMKIMEQMKKAQPEAGAKK